jgi:hypothetical protein
MLGLKISPDLIIILPFALILDLIPIILVCFGLDDVGTTDTIGLVFLGSWLWFRDGINAVSAKKQFKKLTKRLALMAGEYVPYLGVLPFWTILVVMTLKEDQE